MEQFVIICLLLLILGIFSFTLLSRTITSALWAIMLGIAANQVAVVSNGGKMPVVQGVLTIEERILEKSSIYQLATEGTHFKVFVDFIHLRILNSVVSVGDILMFCAVLLPMVWILRRISKTRESFFENNVGLSYSVVFFAMIIPYLYMAFRGYLAR